MHNKFTRPLLKHHFTMFVCFKKISSPAIVNSCFGKVGMRQCGYVLLCSKGKSAYIGQISAEIYAYIKNQ